MQQRKTKIVATIGPASSLRAILKQLIEAGVNVCRLNFSHGTHDSHTDVLKRIRTVSKEVGRPVAILQDLCGPKIRVTQIPNGAIDLVAGDKVTVRPGLAKSDDPKVIGTSQEDLANNAAPGQRLLFDDGLIELEILAVADDKKSLDCQVKYGGTLKKRKGLNLPDTPLDVPSVTDKDKADLVWGIEHAVDYIALSFVRDAADVNYLREQTKHMALPPQVIAKIEKPEAVARLESIVEAFDGVMVARGDLSVEMPLHDVPAIQKEIIRLANLHDKLVITATQMLDSMQEHPRPTRAEVSDVANAIHDGTDAVMLSGETASGRYPVEAVRVMDRISRATDIYAEKLGGSGRHESQVDTSTFADAMCGGAVTMADSLNPCCLVTFTSTGKTARFMSKYHPPTQILGVTTEPRALRRMCLYRGVEPFLVSASDRSEDLVRAAEEAITRMGLGKAGDVVIYVGGTNLATEGNVESVKVRRIGARGLTRHFDRSKI